MGRYDEAIEKFEKALEMNPEYILARANIVIVLMMKEDNEGLEKACREFDKREEYNREQENLAMMFRKEKEILAKRILETKDPEEVHMMKKRKKAVKIMLGFCEYYESLAD